MTTSESLLHWYDKNKRALPWRETRDPYKIWLSEVILQQTRVNQGLEYYNRFVHAFPDIHGLANATEQEVLKLWQGLGYYSRARNMYKTAHIIVGNFNGIFPQSVDGLKKLKGIGDYTAAAIASICYDEPIAVLDGNVARVLSRLYALDTSVDSTAGRSELNDLANNMLSTHHPGTFNQSIMELGALVCTPKNPACNECPLAFACNALKKGNTQYYPIKTQKQKARIQYFNYLVIKYKQNNDILYLMRKRTGNSIWKNMFDFQCIETDTFAETDEILRIGEQLGLLGGLPFVVEHVSDEYIHQLSHRRILARFIRIMVNDTPLLPDNILAVGQDQIGALPIPRLIDKYLETCLKNTKSVSNI